MTIIDVPQLLLKTEQGGQIIQLGDRKSWTLGRGKASMIHLADRCVSRCHARIDVMQTHHCYFVNLSKANGSRINGELVSDPTLLKHGDHIQVGKTEFIFQHNSLMPPSMGAPSPRPQKPVLMLQASSIQGKIWQEILLSQGISTLWGNPGVSLHQIVERNAMNHTLPKVLLIDIAAHRNHFMAFCRWSTHQYPQMDIVFFDRKQPVPEALEFPARAHQVLAFPENRLVHSFEQLITQTQAFLQIYGAQSSLNTLKLQATLMDLDQMIHQMPAFNTLLPESEWALEDEDVTALMTSKQSLLLNSH